jgi:hypothetical protein
MMVLSELQWHDELTASPKGRFENEGDFLTLTQWSAKKLSFKALRHSQSNFYKEEIDQYN